MKAPFAKVILAAVLVGAGAGRPRRDAVALGAGQRLRDAELEKLFLSVGPDFLGVVV